MKHYENRIMEVTNSIRLLGDQFCDSKVVDKIITTLIEFINALYSQEKRKQDEKRGTLKEPFKQKTRKARALSIKRKRKARAQTTKERKPKQTRQKRVTKTMGRRKIHHALIARRPITRRGITGSGQIFNV